MMNAAVETRPTFVTFNDLEDHRTIVIHTGADAYRCGGIETYGSGRIMPPL